MKLCSKNDKSGRNNVAMLLQLMDCNDLEGTGIQRCGVIS